MTATLKAIEPKPNQDAITLLEEILERAREGDIVSVGIVYDLQGGGWGSAFSSSNNHRQDAAMLMELAMRRLGFDR